MKRIIIQGKSYVNALITEVVDIDGAILVPNSKHRSSYRYNNIHSDRHTASHLYVTIDNGIKLDVPALFENREVTNITKDTLDYIESSGDESSHRRIVAGTNKKLHLGKNVGVSYQLPQLSEWFIECYINQEGIRNILIEVETYDSHHPGLIRTKINSDGTVNALFETKA